MTDEERFEIVLRELGGLLLKLGDLRENLVVIGAQVIALEQRARSGSGPLRIELPSGPTIDRGFSFDVDLLYDGEAGSMDERIPMVLRECGFDRSGARWKKRSVTL